MMRKFRTYFLFLGLGILSNFQLSNAQNVTVSGALVGNGSYPNLGAAFTAINGGTQTGSSIAVTILGNTTEPATATLNQGTWTSLVIAPAGGAARTISGAIAGPLINFNGADNVLMDGLNAGGNSLTINNQLNGIASTIQFVNDASTIAVQNCTILGANTSVTSGTIFISTSAGGTGNDNIAFNTCTIDASGANFPTNGVFSVGTAVVGQENSSVVLSGCNISNYYNATAVTAGILVGDGNTGWTIQNNKLFQTTTRLYTTGNIHFGINILSGSAYTISGNTIGFANASGTGTTNMVGNSVPLTGTFPSSYTTVGTANTTRYIGINCTFAAGLSSVVSEIQNNTIAGFALYTSSNTATNNGIFCGIGVNAGNVNIGTTLGNTIGSTTGNGSIYTATTGTGGIIAGIYVNSANTIAIRNNTIGALDAMGTTATVSGGINGINITGAPNNYDVSGNTIGNPTLPNLRMGNLTTAGNLSNVGTTFGVTTGTSIFNGILSSKIGTGTIGTAALPNIIRNALQNSSSNTASIRGITANGKPVISFNTISNLSSESTNINVTSTLLAGMGIFLNSITIAGAVVNNNTIFSLSLINAAANGTNICGIAIYASSTNLYNNKIYNISNASTSVTTATPGTASGFFLRQPSGTINIYNNMVSLGNGQTANTSFNGIWQQNSVVPYALNAYFNSLNIEGTTATGAQPSFCLNRGSYSATQVVTPTNVVDNIFTNTRSGGTSKNYAIANNYLAAASSVGWGVNASNFNVLNAAAANIGYWGGDQTFGGWQMASLCDGNSQSAVAVIYNNAATGDLHLNFGLTPTTLESNGTPVVGITTDYDNQLRPGPAGSVNGAGFAPDLGADEFDGVFIDISTPAITYTTLTSTCGTGDRILTSTITDFTGVPTVGALKPRIYYRKNAGAYFSSQGVLSSGTGTNGTWDFTIVAADMGGLVATDVVSYFVIAQDLAGTSHIGSNPSVGLVATDVNTVMTPPTGPNSYLINPTLSGIYTVGVAGTYPTLTAAVAAYNTACLSGPVEFSLIDVTYPGETFPIVINSNTFASSTNTLTIKPATGVTSTLTGSSATSMISISGGDYITIDGTNGSVLNSLCPQTTATRDLTITNTNVSTTSCVVALQTTGGGNGATNNRVMNCNIVGNSNTTTAVGVNIGGPAIGSGAGSNGNNHNSVVNNSISATTVGIFSSGSSIANKNTANVYDLNDLDSVGAAALGRVGMMILFEDSANIRANNIGNITFTGSDDIMGIALGMNAITNTFTTGSEVTNTVVTGNNINNLVQTTSYSAVGIAVASAATGTNLIANNMVNNVFCNGTAAHFGCGIFSGGGAGTLNIYYNTVQVTGDTLTGADQPNMALGINGTTPNVDIKNNILVCTGENGFAGNTGIGLGYTSTVGNYLNLLSNNNDIFVSGTSAAIGRIGGLAAGTPIVTLFDWQTETGSDSNSVNINPTFVSGTDAHIVSGSNPGIENAGTSLVIVTTDIDCDSRTLTPDLGADEVCFLPSVPTISASVNPICAGDTTSLTLTSGSLNDATSWQWYTISCGGSVLAVGDSIDVVASGTTDYFVRAQGGCVSTGSCANITISVNALPTPTASNTGPYCIGTTIMLSSNGTATNDWSGPSYIATDEQNPTIDSSTVAMSGDYTVTVTDVNSCSATATTTVVLNALPTATAFNTGPYCAGDTIQLNSNGTATNDWAGPSYTATDEQNPTIASSTVAMSGDYTVTVTDLSSCSATATTTVVVNATPTAAATNTGPYCAGATIQLNSPGGSATDDWAGPSYTANNVQDPTIALSTLAMSGAYTVTVTNGSGCSETATTTVVVNAIPSVNLGPDVVQPNPPAVLDAESGFTSYLWSTTEVSQIISVTTNGQYIVTVTTAGCSNSDTIQVNFTSGVVNIDGTPIIMSLYPNPTSGPFNVKIDHLETTDLVIDILDLTGRIVYNRYIGSVSGNVIEAFDMTDLRMGTYVLRMTANGKSTQLRFIIGQ